MTSTLTLDAEALYATLLDGVRAPAVEPDARAGRHLVRRRLAGRAAARATCGLTGAARRDLDVALHRDDYAQRGLHARRRRAPSCRSTSTAAHIAAGRRRALHRPHDPRGDQRAVRLRPAGAASRWRCWSTAAGASCRSSADFVGAHASRCRADAAARRWRATTPAASASRSMKRRRCSARATRSSTRNGELHPPAVASRACRARS